MINFLRYKNFYYIFSGILITLSVLGLVFWRLNFGIDFRGGSLLELKFEKELSLENIQDALKTLNLGNITLQKTSGDIILRFREVDEETHQKILTELKKTANVEEKSFETVGSAIGRELKTKAFYATVFAVIGILLYISFAFRKVSHPVSSWKYAMAAILALFHDVIITLGVFSFLGKSQGVEIDLSFIAAILTVLGYSVNDTIVVFDRIRENLFQKIGKSFEEAVNLSLNQTLARSVFTSCTVIIALLAIYFFGGLSTRYFALALLVGITVGTYSSIFIASPLLVSWSRRKVEQEKKMKK